MPGFVLHLGATVMCSHAGTAQPTSPNPRVLVSGQPVVTLACAYVIAGCSLTPSGSPFCATGNWLTGAMRVTAGGQPLAIVGGSSACPATGNPMLPVSFQTRVTAS
jgi:hypothetical protein